MKSKQELYEQLLHDFEARSGQTLSENSEIAVRLWATAAALESLYYYADWSRQQAFVQTASGEYLDYHGQSRGLHRTKPEAASGMIRFYLGAPRASCTTIPEGTVVAANEQLLFQTTEDCAIESGDLYGDVEAVCVSEGKIGNAPAHSIQLLTDAPIGVTRCDNLSAFSGGVDGEADAVFRERILQSFANLSTGANSAYYYNKVMQCPNVHKCKIVPRGNGTGTVKILVVDAYPDAEQRAKLVRTLNQEREISTTVQIVDAEKVTQLVTYYIRRKAGVSFDEACRISREAVMEYMQTLEIGQTAYLSQITARMIATGILEDCKPVEGAGDLTVGQEQYVGIRLEFLEGNG